MWNVTCPKCSIVNEPPDVVTTVSQEVGPDGTFSKTECEVTMLITMRYNGEAECMRYLCNICEYDWTDPVT